MRRETVFKKGRRITSIAVLDGWTASGQWVYLGRVPKHPLVISSMTLDTLRGFIRRGSLHKATRKKETGWNSN